MPPPAVCVRHPDRATGLSCTRCGRPACPECLREASVGYQCVDCVAEGNRGVRRGVTIAGAEPGGRPLVTPTLVALNVAVFAWTVATSGSVSRNDRAPLFQDWALVPGAVADGEWWRVITAGFLHFGPIHLLFNMMALWVIGRDVEPALGPARFLAVYLVSLLGGSAAVMLFSPPNALVAGASGAVFGLMGALAVLLRRLRIPLGQVAGLIVVNLVITFLLPGISVAGHLGGLVVGAAATAALVYAPADRRVPVQTAALGGLTLLLLAVIASLRTDALDWASDRSGTWLRACGGRGGAYRLGDVHRVVAEVQPAEHQQPLGAVRVDDVHLQHRRVAAQPAHRPHPHVADLRPRDVPPPGQAADGHPVGVGPQPRPGAGAVQRRHGQPDGRDGRQQEARQRRAVPTSSVHHTAAAAAPAQASPTRPAGGLQASRHGADLSFTERDQLSTDVVHTGDDPTPVGWTAQRHRMVISRPTTMSANPMTKFHDPSAIMKPILSPAR